MDFLTGQAGGVADQRLCSQIVRVVIAGNLIGEITEVASTQPRFRAKGVTSETVTQMREVDEALAVLASSVSVDFMPGHNDPTNVTLPQQPLHRCLFPLAGAYAIVKGVSNPYAFELAGLRFLGTSGQGVDDIFRFSTMSDRLEILRANLEWRHLFPTAPDTLGCFPFYDQDPFVISELPHVFFAGNQPEFASTIVQAAEGPIRLICVPRFDTTHTIVLLNLRNLECTPVRFDACLAAGQPEEMKL